MAERGEADEARELARAITDAPPAGTLLEDFTPAGNCLDWRLSQRYYAREGHQAFLAGDVPYVVTNDGHLAANAVEMLLTSLAASDPGAARGEPVRMAELGAGSGLFAKQFLDQLAARAPEVHARLRYTVIDGSQAMLDGIEETGVLADHADQVEKLCLTLPGLGDALPRAGLRAVFANYILDSLPFQLLALDGPDCWELELRTALDAGTATELYTGLTEAELEARLEEGGDAALDCLVDLYPAMVLDARYAPRDRATLPLAETLPEGPRGTAARPYLHSHGALATVAEVLDRLEPGGFLAIADYGYRDSDGADVFEFQHFGGAIAAGLNFESLSRCFGARPGISVVVPENEDEPLVTRLIGRDLPPAVAARFASLYGHAEWQRLKAPVVAAQELSASGQYEAARWKYREALALQPDNWALIEEIAGFLCYRLQDYEGAMRLTRAGLARNHLSAGLWNIAGDCMFYTDHLDDAASAYGHAMAVSPRDPRAALNLAWVAARRGDFDEALGQIALGLSLDRGGALRAALLDKQNEVLNLRDARRVADELRGRNRIRGHRDLPRGGA